MFKGNICSSLIHDLGQDLSVGAHIKTLRRTKIKNICLSQAVSLETLTPDNISSYLLASLDRDAWIDGDFKTPIHRLGLGVFDGCHVGHQKVIENCDKVLSFHPHPDIVLNKNSKLQYLSSKNERKLLIPNILFARFDKPFSQLSAIEFLDAIYDTLNPNIIKVGHDFVLETNEKVCLQFLNSGLRKAYSS